MRIRGGKILAEYRKSVPLTQAELAQRAGVSVDTVKRWEGRDSITIFPSSYRALLMAFEMTGTQFRDVFEVGSGKGKQPAIARNEFLLGTKFGRGPLGGLEMLSEDQVAQLIAAATPATLADALEKVAKELRKKG